MSGATSYTWTLPSGWSGTSATNSITTTAGITGGTITVTANNSCGSSTSQTLTIVVNTAPATPGTISGTALICSGSSNTYSIVSVSGATSYTWALPTGWTGTSTTTTINTTANTSSGNVTVTANNGCGSSTAQTMAVTVNSTPATPGTIAGSATVCQGSTNTYGVTSVQGATSYTWTLPTGWTGTSATNSIAATATNTGGTISVTANNACGISTAQTLTITIVPLPSTPTITQSGSNLVSSATTGNQWYLNGTIITGATNQTYTPATSGNYTVVVTSNGCSSAASSTFIYTMPATYCIPNPSTGTTDGDFIDGVVLGSINNIFSGSPSGPNYTNYTSGMSTTVIKGSAYSVAITSGSYTPDNYAAWIDYNQDGDFGDTGEKLGEFASTASYQTQTIGFTVPTGALTGTTRLRVRCVYNNSPLDPCTNYTYGETEDYQVVIQSSTSLPPVADFTANSTTICAGSTVTFTDLSTNTPASWAWTFTGGSPSSSTSQNPTVVYNASGTYDVTLVATNSFGSSTKIKQGYIVVVPLPSTPTITQSGSNLVSSATTGNQWYLNGTIITGATNQTYTPTTTGNYTVVVTSNGCSSAASSTFIYTMPATYCIPNPSTGTTDGDFIDGVVLGSINNTSSGSSSGPNYTNYTSGMSTTVIKGSAYSVAITSGSYTPDNYAAWIDYNQDGDFGDTGEKLGEFASTASYQSQIIGFTIPTGALTGTTRLRVRCVYSNSPLDPCTNYTYGETEDYQVVIQSSTSLPPVADFTANSTTICAGSTVTFTDLSTNIPASWAWTFTGGNPSSSTAQNPVVVYNTPGTYDVILVATNTFGSSTKNKLGYIVVNTPPAIPTLIPGATSVCEGTNQQYSVLSDTNISYYNWTIPNGWAGSSTTNSITTTAGATGGMITVTASNGCGTTLPDTLNVSVNSLPTVAMTSPGTICLSTPPFVISGGSPSNGNYSGVGVSNNSIFTAVSAGIGTFAITYQYTDNNGCSASATDNITVDMCTDIASSMDNSGSEVIVYPNPFSSITNVHISENMVLDNAAIKVFDVTGKNVLNITNIHSYNITIERKDLQAGIYFYQFMNSNHIIKAGKLVIN